MPSAAHSRSFVNFPEAIPGQFILARTELAQSLPSHPLRTGWKDDDFDGLRLSRSPEVPVVRCRTGRGESVGFFIGNPLDFDSDRSLGDELELADPPADVAGIDGWVEQQVYRFAGRYVFVLTWRELRRVYVDAAASLPVVYDPDARMSGSTAGALYGREDFLRRFDAELFDRMDLLRGGWFPAALTAHRGLQRLICNFYLDLDDYRTHRHWPPKIEQNPDGATAAERTGEEIRRGVLAYLRLGSCSMALTGGHETRLLLSTVRECASAVTFFCLSDANAARDRVISTTLAREFELHLRLLPFPKVSDHEAHQWLARTGYCAGEHRYRYKGVRQLGDFDYCLGGSAGEVGRGFFWRSTDGRAPLNAEEIYSRLGLPRHPAAEQAVASWVDTLPTQDPLLQLDLAYLELRMSCWFAVQTYGSTGPKQGYPMISRAVFTRMLELPPPWRRENRWILHVISRFWPELLDVPINNLGRLREAARSLRRAVRQPSLIGKRLRRKLG